MIVGSPSAPTTTDGLLPPARSESIPTSIVLCVGRVVVVVAANVVLVVRDVSEAPVDVVDSEGRVVVVTGSIDVPVQDTRSIQHRAISQRMQTSKDERNVADTTRRIPASVVRRASTSSLRHGTNPHPAIRRPDVPMCALGGFCDS
jgi:hypothetical protein